MAQRILTSRYQRTWLTNGFQKLLVGNYHCCSADLAIFTINSIHSVNMYQCFCKALFKKLCFRAGTAWGCLLPYMDDWGLAFSFVKWVPLQKQVQWMSMKRTQRHLSSNRFGQYTPELNMERRLTLNQEVECSDECATFRRSAWKNTKALFFCFFLCFSHQLRRIYLKCSPSKASSKASCLSWILRERCCWCCHVAKSKTLKNWHCILASHKS